MERGEIVTAEMPCRHRKAVDWSISDICELTQTPCTGAMDGALIDEDEQDCYEPWGMTASDVQAGVLCGLLIVAGSAIMLLFALSREPWL